MLWSLGTVDWEADGDLQGPPACLISHVPSATVHLPLLWLQHQQADMYDILPKITEDICSRRQDLNSLSSPLKVKKHQETSMYGVQKLFGALQPQCNLLQNKCDPKLIWKDSIYTLNEQWATSDVLHANAFSLVAKWCKIVFYKVSQQDYTGKAVLSHFIFISDSFFKF